MRWLDGITNSMDMMCCSAWGHKEPDTPERLNRMEKKTQTPQEEGKRKFTQEGAFRAWLARQWRSVLGAVWVNTGNPGLCLPPTPPLPLPGRAMGESCPSSAGATPALAQACTAQAKKRLLKWEPPLTPSLARFNFTLGAETLTRMSQALLRSALSICSPFCFSHPNSNQSCPLPALSTDSSLWLFSQTLEA